MTDQKMREYRFETLAYSASTTHAQLSVDEQKSTGVTPVYVRLPVGLVAVDGTLSDLDHALSGA